MRALQGRRILAVGPALSVLAGQALPLAEVQTASAARGEVMAAALARPELVLIDTDVVDAKLARDLIEALAARPDPPGVLLVGAHLPTGLVRALFKLERSDVLEAPITAPDLARAAAAVLADTAGAHATPGRRSHCWSVLGAVGGSGATTLAVEISASLAKKGGPPGSVGLVDLNLADGAAHAYLGASANMRLAEASSAPERIDAALLDAFAVRCGCGFDLLAAPRDPQAFGKVSPAAVCRLLEIACQAYDWVIVDLPRLRQPWSLDVLSGSDEVLIVSELTVPALLSARALAGEIEAELPEARRPRLILNRMANRAFGPAPSRVEAEKALQRKVDGAVTSDWEAAACSVNLGGPISQHRPRSKIVRDVAGLVERLAAQADPAPAHATRAA